MWPTDVLILIVILGVFRVTNHEAVLDCAKGQSVGNTVDTAEDDTTLPPKALCVDDTAPLLS